MKVSISKFVVWAAIAMPLITFSGYSQDDKLNQDLAKRLVRSASVKKGDVVIISGGTHMVRLMEDVAIEVQKAGGFANIFLSSDRVQRAIYTDEPEEFLGQKNDFWLAWYRRADVIIGLPNYEDYQKIIEGIPEARIAKATGAAQDLTSQINALPVRYVSLGIPNAAQAKFANVDLAPLEQMTWRAIRTDYSAISARGARLKALFQTAKKVHVTNPEGTDLTFSMAPGRMIVIDDGIVTADEAKSPLLFERYASLPTGSIIFAPQENSANGKVAVSKDSCRDGTIKDTRFEFKNGKVANYTAATNKKCFPDAMVPYTGQKDVIGVFSIGLNPEMKAMVTGEQNYIPGSGEGIVYVSVGDNRLFGGENLSNAGGWGWAITKATVVVDGKTIIKDGKLVF